MEKEFSLNKLASLLLFILVGCNVAKQPASLSQNGGVSDNGIAGNTFSFNNQNYNRNELSPIVTIPYSFKEAPLVPVNLSFTYSGTATGGTSCATPGVDFVRLADPVIHPAGTLTGVLDIAICNDLAFEGQETIILNLLSSNPVVGLGTIGTTTINLTDSLRIPSLSFSSASSGSIIEGAAGSTVIPVAVQLSSETTEVVNVLVSIAGTATLNSDYSISATSLTFLPGETIKNLNITIFGDGIIEPNENIVLSLFSPSGATLGAQASHEVQIQQDEAPATLVASISNPAAVAESVLATAFTVTLSGVYDQPTTLNFAVDFAAAISTTRRASYPSDFSIQNVVGNCSFGTHSVSSTGLAGTITICPGQTSVTIPVKIENDIIFEPAESVVLRLTGGPLVSLSAFASAELVINQNDTEYRPILTFQTPAQNLLESNASGMISLRLQDPLNSALDRQSGEDVTLTLTGTNVTTQGAADWVLGATTVVIPAGQSRVSIPVTAVQDGVDEEDEVLDVVLANTMGYSLGISTHRVTILDNDAPPTVSFQLASQTIAEAPSDPKTLPVNLVLSRASQRDITVSYQIGGSASTSTSGSCTVTSDVSASGSIVIPAGTTLMPMGLLLCFDQRYEGTETLVLTLQSATNGSLGTSIVHTATITDDEQLPALALSTSDPSPLENDGGFTLTASITNGITAQSDMVVPVTFTGTAVRGAHYQYPVGSITITAGQTSGTLTIDLLNNNLYGGQKSLTATLGTGPWTLSTALQNMTILEDELVPQIGFANPDPVVSEAATAQTLTVHVKPGFPACEGSMTVGLARAGTAVFGSDHDFNFSTAGLAPGQSSTTLSYNIINDNMYEGVANETLQVTITSAICNGVNILLLQPASPSTTTVQIDDDDPQPAVGYEVLTQSFAESDSSAAIVVRLERPSYQAITVRSELVARVRDPGATTTPNAAKYFQAITSGGTVDDPNDLAAGTVDIVIPAGQVTGVHPLNLNNDSNYEYTETATFTLSLPFGGEATVSSSQNQMVVSILDNDPRPFVHLALDNTVGTLSTAESVSEANTAALPVYAVLTNCYRNGATCNRDFSTGLAVPNFAPAKITTVVPIEVEVSLQGTATLTDDYTTTLADSTIVIPAYTQEASVTTTNVDDTLFENAETIRFVASSVINSRLSETNTQVTRTILDDDPAPTITATPSVATAQEGDSVFFTVTVPPIGKAITLSYTTEDPTPSATSATPGVDHNLADGTFIVNPSNIVQNIVLNFTVTNDTTPEAAETIELHMSATPGTDAVFTNPLATLTIDVSDAVRLAAGAEHTCGLLGGQVKCWGKESVLGYDGPAPEITNNGFYGIDAEETVALLPTVNLGAGFVPTKIVAGVDFTCALSSSGNVKCWGTNSRGQVGQGLPNIAPSTFVGDEAGEMGDGLANVILGGQVVDVVAGANHACALLNTGRMKCWGSNEFGQLGQPRTGAACTDTASSFCIGDGVGEMAALNTINFPVDETVVQMAAGTNVTCALLVSGRIYCFGRNNLGQLGQDRDVAEWGAAAADMTDPAFVPVQFNAAFSGLPVVGLVAGDRAICSVFQTNSTRMDVMCWGNGRGRTASPLASVATPAALFNSTFGTVASEFNILRSIAAGSSNVCVRGQGNEVLCWDSDANGRLGNGGAATSTPDAWGTDLTGAARVTNPGFPEAFLNLTTGNNHSCAAVDVDKFRCWGLNTSGQAGNQSAADLTSPSSSIDFD